MKATKKAAVTLTCSSCELPPVHDALVLGKRAAVGINGVVEAMRAMSPGLFKLVRVEHDLIEAVLVRESDLRKVPEAQLLALILEHAGPLMDETEALDVRLSIEVTVRATLDAQ